MFLFSGASLLHERSFFVVFYLINYPEWFLVFFFLPSRKICDCLLGFPRTLLHGNEDKDVFLNDVHSLQNFLRDPSFDAGVLKEGTVQIQVPKLPLFDTAVGDDSEVKFAPPSTQGKRTVLLLKKKKKKVAEDSAANPDSDDLMVRFPYLWLLSSLNW